MRYLIVIVMRPTQQCSSLPENTTLSNNLSTKVSLELVCSVNIFVKVLCVTATASSAKVNLNHIINPQRACARGLY